MIPGIYGFFGEYRFLSNFWYVEVQLDGEYYPSTEHAYQAAKTLDPLERRKFRFKIKYENGEPIESTPTCGEAKKLGNSITLREDWEEIKVHIMRDLLEQKFRNAELRKKLLATEPLYLEETNHWGDRFWGVCNGKGQNILGNLLMELRRECLLEENGNG